MDKIQLRVPKPEDLALAVRDALRPENAPPFVVCGLVFAVLTNVLTGLIATLAYAYVHALWTRSRTDIEGPKQQ